ncbi:ATP-dependent helicase [Nocardioides marmoriginsengisoli]|uniref:DNA 3'-5' helicase n=1 Tax=Nocardioides marmoriginsengisoli TaxID=661483 RepID=A0A3N0CC35_9ACTN|nr:ATP-dependent DNA helicase [Nocardioides marmoriginsengisoli]RNL61015.1 ATP-dependent helicase [Nocardioides marmoriginsengisoli]
MSTAPTGDARTYQEIRDPGELQRVMQAPFPVSEEQWAAISAPLAPAVIIAGAGSGKTTLMAARVIYLVATGRVLPGEVLGLTFTTKAAAELRTRIRRAMLTAGLLEDPDTPEPTVATYNAYASSLLTEHGLRIGHEPDTRVLADASRYQLAAQVVDRHRGRIDQLSDHPETVIQYLLSLDSAMSEHLVTAEEVLAFDDEARTGFLAAVEEERAGAGRKTYVEAPAKAVAAIDRRRELLGLVADYRAAKLRYGVMDFSDQIALSARLAIEQPEVSRLEREKFGVVLLDEYQDTSVAQATMLGRLFSGDDPAHGRGHPVMAVGDPNQAIYGWRGASVSNIVHFDEDFPAAASGGAVPSYPLLTNRRSDERILEVANELARPLYAVTAGVQPLRAKPDAAPGEVRALVHEHTSEELGWLAENVLAAHAAMAEPLWSEIGVLVRDNAHAAEVFDVLSRAEVPVEIVGLNGLLRLPEVAEVVATLRLLSDLSANDALLTLLAGPRWAIGPRDLALLGRRAAEIAGSRKPDRPEDVVVELGQAVEGNDPTEIPSLSDALDDPGPALYSAEAQARFGLLSGELRYLRGHVHEPLLDLVRRIIDACGIDIELAAAVSPAASARRDNLDLFVKAVAEFQAVDGGVSLAALLAYLNAEDELGTGLDVATPTRADSVKLLTVHRAKGLEWDVVFLVGVGEGRFPTTTSRTLWTSSPSVLPNPLRGDARDLAQLRGHDRAALEEFRAASKAKDGEEELRLGYVAFTRARHTLWVSSYLWGVRPTPFGPSPYQGTVRDCMTRWGQAPDSWFERPPAKTPHPYAGLGQRKAWPVSGTSHEVELRIAAAAAVAAARESDRTDPELDVLEATRVAEWDGELERLLAEARADRSSTIEVPMPSSLSATSVARLVEDAEGFVGNLARPMPRMPSRAARFGTRFHAWVEQRFGQQHMLDPDDLPGRADVGIEDDADFEAVVTAFEAGEFADRVPHATEAPFALVLGGQVVRGRIDAVYAEPGPGPARWLVIDWKTGRRPQADPLQLALYRLAWAELQGVPLEDVRAAFVFVRTGTVVEPSELPGRDGLEAAVRVAPEG